MQPHYIVRHSISQWSDISLKGNAIYTLDRQDRAIIAALQKDGRMTNTALIGTNFVPVSCWAVLSTSWLKFM